MYFFCNRVLSYFAKPNFIVYDEWFDNDLKKTKLKSKWLIGCKKKHKDDIASLETLTICDDCEIIKKIGNWEIKLTLDNKFIEETNYPDWYGYQKIDVI